MLLIAVFTVNAEIIQNLFEILKKLLSFWASSYGEFGKEKLIVDYVFIFS